MSANAGITAKLGLDTTDFDKGLKESAGKVGYLAEKTEASSQRQTQSWGRVEKAIGATALVSGGMFKAMVDASPGLSAAFAEINFLFEEMFMVFGDQLAPRIQDTLVPAIESLTSFIISLDSDTQTYIATGIGLVAGLSIVSSALGMVGLSFTALLGPIGLAIIAIAAFAYAYKTNLFGVRDKTNEIVGYLKDTWDSFVTDHTEQIGSIVQLFKDVWEILEPIIMAIGEVYVKYLYENLKYAIDQAVNTLDYFLDIIEGVMKIIKGIFTLDFDLIMEGFGDIFVSTIDYFITSWNNALEHVANLFAIFRDGIVDVISAIFGEDIGAKAGIIMDALTSVLNIIVGWINDLVIGTLNNILGKLAKIVDKIPGVDRPNWSLNEIPTFHGGGTVPGPIGQPQMILALGGEEVYNPMRGQTAPNITNGGNTYMTNKFNFNNSQFPDRMSERRLSQTIDTQLRKNLRTYPGGRT